MAKFTEQSVSAALQPYLNTGETLTNAAYCAYQSPLAFLLGPVGLALFTKVFIVGLTTRRVIILNLAKSVGGNINVLSFRTYDFDNLPIINATFGTFATEVRITDPAAPFRANFPMAGVPSNYQRGQMIARELLTRWQNQGAMPASGQDVGQSTPTTETATAQLAQSPASSPPAQFAQQTSTAQYPAQQSSATVYGCLGAALIAFGSGVFLLAALVLIGMSLDSNKTTRDTIGGIIGGGTMILFAAAMIAVGVYVLRLRRSMKTVAPPRVSSTQQPPQATQLSALAPTELSRAQVRVDVTGDKDFMSLISDLNHRDAEVRGQAAETLGRMGDSRAVKPLMELMRAESLKILQGTISLYGSRSDANWESHESLIKARVRARAADALGMIGPAAIPALLTAVRDGDERFLMVREEAARVLGELKADEAVPALIAILAGESKPATKEIALKALASIGGPEAEQALQREEKAEPEQ